MEGYIRAKLNAELLSYLARRKALLNLIGELEYEKWDFLEHTGIQGYEWKQHEQERYQIQVHTYNEVILTLREKLG